MVGIKYQVVGIWWFLGAKVRWLDCGLRMGRVDLRNFNKSVAPLHRCSSICEFGHNVEGTATVQRRVVSC